MSELAIAARDGIAAYLLGLRLGIPTEIVTGTDALELHAHAIRVAELPGMLATLERWMDDEELASVAVRLDDRSYVLVRGQRFKAQRQWRV